MKRLGGLFLTDAGPHAATSPQRAGAPETSITPRDPGVRELRLWAEDWGTRKDFGAGGGGLERPTGGSELEGRVAAEVSH